MPGKTDRPRGELAAGFTMIQIGPLRGVRLVWDL
jgi:hypothetical protein